MFGGTRRRPNQIEVVRTATLVGGTINGSFGTEQDSFTCAARVSITGSARFQIGIEDR